MTPTSQHRAIGSAILGLTTSTAASAQSALPATHVARPRLLEMVPVDTPLVCIVAAAGWGKTVLLRELAERAIVDGRSVAWMDLAASRADPALVWNEIAAAVPAVPTGRPQAEGKPRPSAPTHSFDADHVLRRFDEWSRAGDHLTVVVDDLHLLPDPAVRAEVLGLAPQLPPGVQLLVASRHHLGVAHGSIVEVNDDDLRFTVDEVRSLMGAMFDDADALDDARLAGLMTATEGWAALVRFHLGVARDEATDGGRRGRVPASVLVEDFVLDEVIDRLPSDLIDVVLGGSVFELLTVEACQIVTGRSDSAEALQRLARLGTPATPLHPGRPGLRLHPALRSAARRQLARTDRDRWQIVHRRAVEHLLDTDAPLDAVDLLLDLSDHEAAIDVLVHHHRAIVHCDALGPLVDRTRRLPLSLARSHPGAAADLALLLIASGRFASAARLVNALRQADIAPELRAARAAAELAVHGIHADVDRLLDGASDPGDVVASATTPARPAAPSTTRPAAGHAQGHTPGRHSPGNHSPGNHSLLAGTWHEEPIALLLTDRFDECDAAIERSRRSGFIEGSDRHATAAVWSFMSAWRGRMREAARSIEAARHELADPACSSATFVRLPSAELMLRLQTDDPADDPAAVARDARELLTAVADRFDRHTTYDVPIAVIALRASRLAGEPWRAFDGSIPLVHSVPTIARPWLASLVAEELVRCACQAGDVPAAERALGQVRGALASTLARAHILIARHEIAGARAVLADVDIDRLAVHAPLRAVDVAALRHLTASTSRELAATLATGRAIADEHGLDPSSVTFGHDLRSAPSPRARATGESTAAEATVPHGNEATGVDSHRIDANRAAATGSSNDPAAADALRDPLSAREIDVLRLLPTDLPTAEIARELFVSVNTVKTHIKSVYRKLGVGGRYEAVQRARELGVLPPIR